MPVSAFGGEPSARHLSQHACIVVQQSLLRERSSTGQTCPNMTRELSDVASNRETQCGAKLARVTELMVKSAMNGSPWFSCIPPPGAPRNTRTEFKRWEDLRLSHNPTQPWGNAKSRQPVRLLRVDRRRRIVRRGKSTAGSPSPLWSPIRCHEVGTPEPDLSGEQAQGTGSRQSEWHHRVAPRLSNAPVMRVAHINPERRKSELIRCGRQTHYLIFANSPTNGQSTCTRTLRNRCRGTTRSSAQTAWCRR